MAALDLTSFAAALKTLYSSKRIENLTYQTNPLLAMLPKNESFYGDSVKQPLVYGNVKGRSVTFATAQSNKAASSYAAFTVTRVKDYALASIDNETLEASKSDKGAFMRAAQAEIDSAFRALGRSIASALYRSGSGSVGVVATGGISTTALTLASPGDVVNFEVGMKVQASATDGSALIDSGAAATLTAINRDTGVLTASANWTTTFPTPIAAGYYLYIQGDAQSAASARTKISGLQAWLPTTAPSSTSFFGVDRSVDTTRLGGVRYDGSALTIEEALINGVSRVGVEGGKTDYIFMNPLDVRNLVTALGTKVMYTQHKVGDIGFEGLKVACDNGPVTVMSDLNCPQGYAFALQMDTWELASLGKAPRLLDSDGNRFLREASADAIEVRCGFYGNLLCSAPGFNAVITLPST